MRAWASFLLVLVTAPPRQGIEIERRVEFAFLAEALDPHLRRLFLLEEAEEGLPFGRARG